MARTLPALISAAKACAVSASGVSGSSSWDW